MQDISGKTAIVTGAASGIGLGIAAACLARGATVTIASRGAARLEADGVDGAVDLGRAEDRVQLVADRALGNVGRLEAERARVREALPAHGRVCILETFWNRQRHEAARALAIDHMQGGHTRAARRGDRARCCGGRRD